MAGVARVSWKYQGGRPLRSGGARRYFILAIQLLLTVGLLYFSFRGIDFRAALHRVSAMPLSVAALCFLLLGLQILLLAWRWHALLEFLRCKASPSALV